ncbi:hypothetical protein KC867_03435, partial [Candidatus Saccharibacteria bacterium]|nr:hypothetical protein [Candidatus Saccharibacteria bacterium]
MIANEALLSSLHSLGNNRIITERILGRKNRFCLEIVSTKDKGIRFYVSCLKHQEQSLRKLVEAHLPHAKVKRDTATLNDSSKVVLVKQSNHYAFPIKNITSLDDHDPLGYVTSAMANIADNEALRFQLVCTPVHLRSADKIREKILHNESFMPGDITAKK